MGVVFDRDPNRSHVGHLRIQLGELNLLDPDGIDRILETVDTIPSDVVVLTITPEGTVLSGGLDLTWAVDRDTEEGWQFLAALYGMIQTVRDLDTVTICGCGRAALGAGFELALGCDFRVATADAELGLPEVDVGLPTVIHGGLLIRHLGVSRAKQLIYLGETIDGERAEALGLVHSAPPADQYDAAVEGLVDRLAGKSPTVLRWQKRTFRRWRSAGVESGMEGSIGDGAMCFGTADQQEAMQAFLEGREPTYGKGSEPY